MTVLVKDISNIRTLKQYPHVFLVRGSVVRDKKVARDLIEEIYRWCEDRGRAGGDWFYGNYEFSFRDENLAFEFKLRWAGLRLEADATA